MKRIYIHPALQRNLCMQGYGNLRGRQYLCARCERESVALHQHLAAAIKAQRNSLCCKCAKPSIGVIVFRGEFDPFCEDHARYERSVDLTVRDHFLPYGALRET